MNMCRWLLTCNFSKVPSLAAAAASVFSVMDLSLLPIVFTGWLCSNCPWHLDIAIERYMYVPGLARCICDVTGACLSYVKTYFPGHSAIESMSFVLGHDQGRATLNQSLSIQDGLKSLCWIQWLVPGISSRSKSILCHRFLWHWLELALVQHIHWQSMASNLHACRLDDHYN